jgi:hypothetical protein
MKSKVMKLAHLIKAFFNSWSRALKAAWIIVKLHFERAQVITFAKSDGEVRKAKALLVTRLETAAKGYIQFVEDLGNGETQWRSFRIERLIF